MNVTPTALPGVLVIEPRRHGDRRGFFMETWQAERYAALGLPAHFAQDNVSRSARHTLRGLHFQEPGGQGKLVSVIAGQALDVVVDVRRGSPTFARWVAVELDGETMRQIWVPRGFAHGFLALSDTVDFLYKCDAPYRPDCEHTLRWDDPDLAIDWPVAAPILSDKDARAPLLRDMAVLPAYAP